MELKEVCIIHPNYTGQNFTGPTSDFYTLGCTEVIPFNAHPVATATED